MSGILLHHFSFFYFRYHQSLDHVVLIVLRSNNHSEPVTRTALFEIIIPDMLHHSSGHLLPATSVLLDPPGATDCRW